MKSSLRNCFVAAATAFGVVCLAVMPSAAQTRTPAPAADGVKSGVQSSNSAGEAPTPRTSEGHPDLSGVYYPGPQDPEKYSVQDDDRSNQRYLTKAEKPSYQPWALEKIKLMGNREVSNGNLAGRCTPPGAPSFFFKNRVAVRFIQTSKDLVILDEEETTYRVIYTDGRQHPKSEDVYPLFMGDAIGHWDGDTLLVDTIGVDVHASVGGGGPIFASDVAHYQETFRRPNAKTLLIQFALEDPKVLTKPWTSPVSRYTWAPNREIEEQFDCMNSLDIQLGLAPPDAGKPVLTAYGTDERFFDEQEYEELSKKYNNK